MKRSTAIISALAVTAAPAVAQAPVKIRVAVAGVESYSQGAYAQEMGFYKHGGLEADVQSLINGGVITAAVIGGSIDFGTTNGGSMANAFVHGLPIYCIAPSGIYTSASPTTVLVVAKDSPIRTAKDLNGKKVAVTTLHDLMQAAFMKWIDDNGGDSSTITYPEIHNADLLASLFAKRVDACALLEPQLTEERDNIRILAPAYDAVAKLLLISGWITTKTFYENNRSTVQRFLGVMRETSDWANKNPRAAAGVLSKLSKIPLDVVLRMNHTIFGTTNDPALIQPTIDASAHYGFLPRSFPATSLFPPA